MKLLVIGSTGGTGRELVKQALEQGHEVTAFARAPEKLSLAHQNLRIVKGDVTDDRAVEQAVAGQDGVLCALGTQVIRKNTIQSDGARNLVRAMQKNGVRRLVLESSLDVGDSRGQLGFFFAHVIRPTILKNIFNDKELQEQIVRESRLDWIIVRPAMLTDGPRTGNYRAGFAAADKTIKRKISRADVADFMLKQLIDDTYLRATPGLSY
ncbi:MAG TPA: SDR family oxidoreductase [Terriglobales bacterium]|nr:SDR family oxidoreductase [Terriglobales bacterium]